MQNSLNNSLNYRVKKHVRRHKGLIGLEAVIILIAFVIIAGAISLVVLNIGIFTTQQSKTIISSAIDDSSSTVMVSGTIIGSGHPAAGRINITAVPIKIIPGGDTLNIAAASTAIKYFNNDISYDNIYRGTINPGVKTSLQSATATAKIFSYIDWDPFVDNLHPTETSAFIYWSQNKNDNDILDFGEKAILVIVFAENDRPEYRDTLRMEMISRSGPALTLELKIPQILNEVIILG